MTFTVAQPDKVDVEFYVLIEPKWKDKWYVDPEGDGVLDGARLAKATVNRPSVGRQGGLITKITLRLDAKALLPLQPQAVIQVNAGNSEVIEVEAIDPHQEES